MKLYTEQQVRQAYIDGMDFIAVDPTMYEQDADEYMSEVHSIVLPTDEEIESASYRERYKVAFNPFASGAQWMRDKLTNTKEK